jgi:hypothetical protein
LWFTEHFLSFLAGFTVARGAASPIEREEAGHRDRRRQFRDGDGVVGNVIGDRAVGTLATPHLDDAPGREKLDRFVVLIRLAAQAA